MFIFALFKNCICIKLILCVTGFNAAAGSFYSPQFWVFFLRFIYALPEVGLKAKFYKKFT